MFFLESTEYILTYNSLASKIANCLTKNDRRIKKSIPNCCHILCFYVFNKPMICYYFYYFYFKQSIIFKSSNKIISNKHFINIYKICEFCDRQDNSPKRCQSLIHRTWEYVRLPGQGNEGS